MERREIELFLTLAEELHFGRTADRLHVSTARVSQTIRRLEQRFGARLFERTSRHVALTPLGTRLRDDLAPAFAQLEAGIERAMVASRQVQGQLRVGFFRAAAGRFVLDVAELFGDRHPGCEVEIRENQLNDGLTPLRAGDIDVLFLMLPVDEPDLVTGPVLVREPRLLAVSNRHPLVRRPSIGVEDLAADRVLTAPAELPEYVRRHVVPEATPAGKPLRPGPAFATVQEMLSLVGAGRGIYPVPAQTATYYARPDVAYLPITGARPFEWALTWRRATENRRVRAFATAAKDLVRRRSGTPVLPGFDAN